MRRLLAICSAVGLLCGALGCHSCCGSCGAGGGGHVSGRCDCDEGPEYGCCFDLYAHGGHGGPGIGPVAAPMPQAPAEPLKALPKDVTPKEE
jgi:hypothetical protein